MAKLDVNQFFAYMGNKKELAEWIVPMFPPHQIYGEIFGGTYALGLNKTKSPFEFYNDLNVYLSNLFEVVRSNKDEFIEQICSHNISQVTYERYYMNHEVVTVPDMESAIRYYYIMSLCALGKYTGGFQPDITDSEASLLFVKQKSVIEKIHNRIKDIIIFCRPYDKIIKKFDREDALIYLDPPYVNTESYYKKLVGEFTVEDHVKLRDILSKFKGKFVLSYEDNDLIRTLYKGFNLYERNKFRQSKGEDAVEIVITNYKIPNTLFDTSIEL
jgi:DNA adenine methylase